jgi:hypothetical protein
MFAQLDELTLAVQGSLSHTVLFHVERMFKDLVDYSVIDKKVDIKIAKEKKRQICERFCREYSIAAQQAKSHFLRLQMINRSKMLNSIKDLYINVLMFEKTKTEPGNLLA